VEVDMSGSCDRWLWQLSGYDGRVHAFERPSRVGSFLEAVCGHCVPVDRLVRRHEGSRCLTCLLIVGDRLADHHRIGAGS
jgi:hypothetical protein